MSEKSFGGYAKELKQDISSYVELRLEHSKLVVYEKIAKVSAVSLSLIVIIFFAFFAFFFLSFAGGYFLGKITGSTATGFIIVGCVYIVLLFIVVLLRKNYFEKAIIEKVIDVLMEDDDTNETK